MDLDGDGFLSMYELEYFYEEQLQRMEQLGIETLPFEDCLCQVRLKNKNILYLQGIFTGKNDLFKISVTFFPEENFDLTKFLLF